MREYRFTSPPSENFARVAESLFASCKDQPTHYLEIGTYEGYSACWMLDNILLHPESHCTCIDQRPYSVAQYNLEQHRSRVTYLKGNSLRILPSLFTQVPCYDLIYVDGDHREAYCFEDIRHSWRLLVPGGILLCDDYLLERSSLDPTVLFGVKPAVDRFLGSISSRDYTILYQDYMIGVRKNASR